MHISKAKLLIYPPCEVKCGLQKWGVNKLIANILIIVWGQNLVAWISKEEERTQYVYTLNLDKKDISLLNVTRAGSIGDAIDAIA